MIWKRAITIAQMKEQQGQRKKALKYFKQALEIAKNTKSKEEEVSTLLCLGKLCCESFQNYHDAIKYLEQGLPIAQEIANKKQESRIYRGLGDAYNRLEQYDKCASFSKQALNIAIRLGDASLIGDSYFSLANCYAALCEYQNSIKCYKKALDKFEQLGDEEGLGSCYTNMSSVYQYQGKFYDASDCQEKSLRIADRVGDKQMKAASLNSLGNINAKMNNLEKAADFYKQSLTVAIEIKDKHLEQCCYGNLGVIYYELNKYEQAISILMSQLEIADEMDTKEQQALAHLNVGMCFREMNQYQDAMDHYNQGLVISKEINKKELESSAYYSKAVLFMRIGELQEAINMANKSLDIALSIGRKETEQDIYRILGALYHLLSKNNKDRETHESCMSKSEEYLRKALDCHDYFFTHLRHHDHFKISIFENYIKTYKHLTTVLIETQQTQEALLVSDRGRARALGDRLTEAYGMSLDEFLPCKPLTYPEVESVCSNDAFTLLHYSLIEECLAVWILTKDSMTFKEIDKEQFISAVDTLFGENEKEQEGTVSHIFADAVTRAYQDMRIKQEMTCENRSIDDCMTTTNQPCDRVTESVSRDGTGGEKAEPELHPLKVLYNTLIAPVLSDTQHNEIVIVPDSKMYTVPFAALKDPTTRKYLSESKRIRIVPSIAVLKLLQECPVDHHHQQGALIVGNPSVGEVMFRGEKRTFSELHSAGVEVLCVSNLLDHAVQRWHANNTVTSLTEKEATKDAVLAKMEEGVAIIHIAAHGDADHGEIVLAPITSQDRQGIPVEQDYLLTMKEVQEVGVKAQLVVLSCCHSGQGEIRAEGMIGLSRAFLAAGARAVVASLWAISDEVTLNFMCSFYDSLCKGNSASVSLDEAMKDIRSEPEHRNPKYWAPFFLIGDEVTINFGQ